MVVDVQINWLGWRGMAGWIEMALLEVSEDVAAVDADRWAAMDMDGAWDGCVVRGVLMVAHVGC
ncbi:hypothetical protein DVH05_020563 [Phytophthora capsici]|nr:hypothetical protein DVH05_020563 [Phytophthora capsici]